MAPPAVPAAPAPAAAAAAVKKDADKQMVECMACACNMARDHTGITCLQNHHICADCSPGFVTETMKDLSSSYRCAECQCGLVDLTFERQLDESQLVVYLAFMAAKQVKPGEYIKGCPFCPYFEIRVTADGKPLIFACRNSGAGAASDSGKSFGGKACGRASCGICHKEMTLMTDDDAELEEEEYEAKLHGEKGIGRHFECSELAGPLEVVEEALEDGEKVACPHCGHKGRKDGACTHMLCPKCAKYFCYFCTRKMEDCDGATADDFGDHNVGWRSNPKRCPWFLEYIALEAHARNPAWPEDAEACVTFYHRQRALRKLREAYDAVTPPVFARLVEKYGTVRNCGYSEKEIAECDAKADLIKRCPPEEDSEAEDE